MSSVPVEQRVMSLEALLAEVLRAQARTEEEIQRTEAAFQRTEAASQRTEAQLQRTDAQIERTQAQVERTSRELAEFKEETRVFQERSDADRRFMSKRWGELANKMGTLVEDIVAPGVPSVLRELVGVAGEPEMAVRVRRRHPSVPGVMQEFDVVAEHGGTVLVVEVKSTLAQKDVEEAAEKLSQARMFLRVPEGVRMVGALAALYTCSGGSARFLALPPHPRTDPSVVTRAERAGFLVLGLGEDLLEVLNTPGFTPRPL